MRYYIRERTGTRWIIRGQYFGSYVDAFLYSKTSARGITANDKHPSLTMIPESEGRKIFKELRSKREKERLATLAERQRVANEKQKAIEARDKELEQYIYRPSVRKITLNAK